MSSPSGNGGPRISPLFFISAFVLIMGVLAIYTCVRSRRPDTVDVETPQCSHAIPTDCSRAKGSAKTHSKSTTGGSSNWRCGVVTRGDDDEVALRRLVQRIGGEGTLLRAEAPEIVADVEQDAAVEIAPVADVTLSSSSSFVTTTSSSVNAKQDKTESTTVNIEGSPASSASALKTDEKSMNTLMEDQNEATVSSAPSPAERTESSSEQPTETFR
ncbi:hypothetical protein BC829DRAFT_443911 [Chytridium lagenaria]|nr:hypothetical protein BC829DRAFT_443911 [Chytridium lagenaria]